MKKNISAGVFFGVLLASIAGFLGFSALRPPVALAEDTCGITAADINQITTIQNNPNLSYSEELSQELALRKKLVGQTITCATKEAQALQANLQSTSTDSGVQSLQAQFLGDINNATNFYSIEQAKLNGAGIAGTESIAKEMLQWRETNFIPLAENINNFDLWSQNQILFDTAATRMDQTKRAVTFIESATPNPDLQSALDQAIASFTDAQSDNTQAESALAQGVAPDQSLALIKQSLTSLSDTYQDFFTVSTLINTVLPS